MDVVDFSSILVVGVFLSFLVQAIKAKFGTTGIKTKLVTLGLAVLVGGLFVFIKMTPFFETIVTVLMTSSTVYALFIKE